MNHKFECVVHDPKPTRRKPKHFHSSPKSITDENRTFWNQEKDVVGSICKDCYTKFEHRAKSLIERVDISPKDSKVSEGLLY